MSEPSLSPEVKKQTTKKMYEKNKTNFNTGQNDIPDQSRKNCHDHQKRSLRNWHSQEEPKNTWQLNVRYDPEWNPAAEKGYEIKTKDSWIRYGLSLIIMHQDQLTTTLM